MGLLLRMETLGKIFPSPSAPSANNFTLKKGRILATQREVKKRSPGAFQNTLTNGK